MDAPWQALRDDASRLDLDADSTIVDAVLAFIDNSEDIPLEPAQTNTDGSSSPTKPKSTGNGKNTRDTLTFHQRQQAEIKRLRSDVLLLEDQLLKARNRDTKHQQGASIRDQCSRGRQQGGLVIETPSIQRTMWSDTMKLWENMATRHKQLAMASRQENKRLRELVADQERAIRNIRRTLRRLARRQAEVAGRLPRPIRGGAIPSAIYREDAVVAQLCGGVVQLYKTSDLAFQLSGLQTVDTLPLHERVHQLNPTTSIAQIVCSHLLPFGFRDTRKAMGDSKAVLCLQASTLHDHREIEWDGATLRAYRIDYMDPSKQMGVVGFRVLGKFVENRRTIAIENCVAYPVCANGARVNGVTYQEQARVLVSNVADATIDLCRVQASVDFQIEIEPTVPGGLEFATEFRDVMVHHKSKVLKHFVQELEHVLLVN